MTGAQDGRLTDDHRRRLRELERAKKPTEWQRGELAALRLHAVRPDDQRRVQDLSERWASR